MQKYKFKLRTISKVILSGRESNALYKGIDYNNEHGDCNIIYPFYSYEDRMLRNDEKYDLAKSYYLPGSSFKGALLQSIDDKDFRRQIKTYDTQIERESIKRITLKKMQYIYPKNDIIIDENVKTPTFNSFMPSVGIESLKENTDLEVCIATTIERKGLDNIIKNTDEITREKLKRYMAILEDRLKYIKEIDAVKKEDHCNLNILKSEVEEVYLKIKNVCSYKDRLMFIGGYKGLNNSLEKVAADTIQTGLFIDGCTKLPYGLVSVSIM